MEERAKLNKCDSCNNVYSHRQSLWRHKQNCNNKRIRADTASYPGMEKREKKLQQQKDYRLSRLPTVDDEDENTSSRKWYALADYTASVRMWTTRRRSDSGKEIIEVRICR